MIMRARNSNQSRFKHAKILDSFNNQAAFFKETDGDSKVILQIRAGLG